jgi:hypothetical protein
MKMISLALTLVMASSITQAATQTILNLGNDRDSNVTQLGVQADPSGALQKFTYTTHQGTKTFAPDDLATGAVLEEQQGVQALILTGQVSLGKLAMKYVYNGLSKEYRSCNMTLTRSSKGDWALTNAYTGAALRNAKIITWSLGISTLQGLCQQ